MTQLTKNVRTHIVQLNDGRELQITQEQYATLKLQLEDLKFSDPLVITDPDTNEIMFDGKVGAIKEFKHKKTGGDTLWVICDYGVRHQLIDGDYTCDCRNKIGIVDTEYYERLKEMGYNINYPRDVTNEIIRAYKAKYYITN